MTAGAGTFDAGAVVGSMELKIDGVIVPLQRAAQAVDAASKKMASDTSRVTTGFAALKAGVSSTVAGLSGFGLAVGAIGAGLFALVKHTGEAAVELRNLGARTGMTRQQLQELQVVAKGNELEFGMIVRSVQLLQRNLMSVEAGTGNAAKVLKNLGLNVHDANKQLLPMNEIFFKAIELLQKVRNPTLQATYAAQIFGRSYAEILPLLRMGSEEMKNETDAAHKMSLVWSDELYKSAIKVHEEMVVLEFRFEAMKLKIVGKLLPALLQLEPQFDAAAELATKVAIKIADLIEGFSKLSPGLQNAILGFSGLVTILAGGGLVLRFSGIGRSVIWLGGLFVTFAKSIGIAAVAWRAGAATFKEAGAFAIAANGIGLVVAAAAAAAYEMYNFISAWNKWQNLQKIMRPPIKVSERTQVWADLRAAKIKLKNMQAERSANPPLMQKLQAQQKLEGDIYGTILSTQNEKLAYQGRLVEALQKKYDALMLAGKKANATLLDKDTPKPPPDVEKAHKAATDALTLEKARLELAIIKAKTDAQTFAIEKQQIALYLKYAGDPRMTQVERIGFLTDAIKLQADMSKEEFADAERNLQTRKAAALSYDEQKAAIEGLIVLYGKEKISTKLNQGERSAANTKLITENQALLALTKEHEDALLKIQSVMSTAWGEERTAIADSLRLEQERVKTLAGSSRLQSMAKIIELQTQLWNLDEQHLQVLHEITLEEEKTIAGKTSILQAELSRTRGVVTIIQGELAKSLEMRKPGVTQDALIAARKRVLDLESAINKLTDERLRLEEEYTNLMIKTREDIDASYAKQIADQQAFIDNAARDGREEKDTLEARNRIISLGEEQRSALLRFDLDLVEEEIALYDIGYAKKIALLQDALALEKKITEQGILRDSIRATAEAAIASARAKIERSGQWELMTLEQQGIWVTKQLEVWSKIAGVALPGVKKELEGINKTVADLNTSWQKLLHQIAIGWQTTADSMKQLMNDILDTFQNTIRAMMAGTATFKDFFLSIWNNILDYLSRFVMQQLTGWLDKLFGGGASDGATQLQAAGTQVEAAILQNTAAANQLIAAQMNAGAGQDGGSGLFDILFSGAESYTSGGEGGGAEGFLGGALDSGMGTGGYGGEFASGGIVTRPTLAMVGERGPEAIIPLSGKAGESLGGTTEVYLTVNALDARSVSDLLMRDGGASVAAAVQVALRNNNPLGRRR